MKTLADLPQFFVTAVKQGGFWELSGAFDQVAGVREGRCWLLLPGSEGLVGLSGRLAAFHSEMKTAVVLLDDEEPPSGVLGARLAWLDGYWRDYHVWMVVKPEWTWTEVMFQASDAVAGTFQDAGGHKRTGIRKQHTRSGPAPAGAGELVRAVVVPGGWDHEHCELCNAHIDSGDVGYVDRSYHWVCTGCYRKYVSVHDLSFLDV